jgi:hypothetical protein
MNIFKIIIGLGAIFLIASLFIILNINCQYEYRSPLPGTIEVRLKSLPNRDLEFSRYNNFIIKITKLYAIRNDGGRVKIYEDVKAIETSTMIVNTLDSTAKNGELVIGQTSVPPGNYIGIDLEILPGPDVVIGAEGVEQQVITVQPPTTLFPITPRKAFEVKESRTTKIFLVIDLDKTLQKNAFNYRYVPQYDITIEQ